MFLEKIIITAVSHGARTVLTYLFFLNCKEKKNLHATSGKVLAQCSYAMYLYVFIMPFYFVGLSYHFKDFKGLLFSTTLGAKIERWNWRHDQCQCHQWSWQSQSVSLFHFLCILWTIFDHVGRYPHTIRNFTVGHICRHLLHAWSWYSLGHHQFDCHCHDSHQFRWNDVLVSHNWLISRGSSKS